MEEQWQSIFQLDMWLPYLREICCLFAKIIYIILKCGLNCITVIY